MNILEDTNRIRILKTAHHLFNSRGYRSVTVQDLASELGMSKKTIYQYFSGKEEIASAVVDITINKIAEIKNKSELDQLNPLLTLKEILLNTEPESVKLKPLFLMDIQKYLPELADKYNEFRNEGKKLIERLLKRSQDTELIKDIPINLVIEILHESLHALVKSEFLSQHVYSANDVKNTFIDIFFSGIAAPKNLK
jgi:AcrR family transcriptional regulator